MQLGLPRRKRRGILDRLFMFTYSLKGSDRILFSLACIAFLVSLLWFIVSISTEKSILIPTDGGTLIEGVVGTPRFVNPILAVTRADKDLSDLVYAGLARLGEDGSIVPDLAESITISEDGLVYNVILRSDIIFSDGTPVQARDIAFTIGRIQDPLIASPLRASWDGVTIEVINERELNFVLEMAYAPFIENLTLGIVPEHIWKDASSEEFPFSQYNSEPIGAGPYVIGEIIRDTSGIPKSYTLHPNAAYHGEVPKIHDLTIEFFPNEEKLVEAFNAGLIMSAAGLGGEAIKQLVYEEGSHTLVTSPLPRTFAVFFNQNKSAALRDESARQALNAMIDRDELIADVLDGYAVPLTGPVPPGFGITITEPETSSTSPLDTAREILREGGWEMNEETGIWEKEIDDVVTPLSFSISTANSPVFEETAEFIRAKWEQLGAGVTVKQFEQSDLTQSIIRPRDYEALLFGTALGRALDFYSFWHSSQRNDPGLNIALYANITTDSILTGARTSASTTMKQEAYQKFTDEIAKETPAVFLYSPLFTYVFPERVVGESFTGLAEPHERFTSISKWYIETDSVWPLFNE